MPVADQITHTAGVITALQAAGLTVGDGTGKDLAPPFAVVHDISDRTSGTLGDRNSDTEFVYQVTCVGRVPAEARYVRNKAMLLLNGITVSGRSIALISKEDGSGGVRRDDDVTPPRWYATPRFRVLSVPS